MFDVSDDAAAVLTSVGWARDRQIDIAEWIRVLSAEGLEPFPMAEAVLRNLGGISILPPFDEYSAYRPSVVEFDPVLGGSGEADNLSSLQRSLRQRLFPVGECFDLDCMAVTPSGHVYSFTSGDGVLIVHRIGSSVREALDVLMLARQKPFRLPDVAC